MIKINDFFKNKLTFFFFRKLKINFYELLAQIVKLLTEIVQTCKNFIIYIDKNVKMRNVFLNIYFNND